MEFYENLREARLRAGLTQVVVAKAVGITSAALSNYETGYREPDLYTLARIATLYGVHIDDLLGVEIEEKQPKDLWGMCLLNQVRFLGVDYAITEEQREQIKSALTRILNGTYVEEGYEEVDYRS